MPIIATSVVHTPDHTVYQLKKWMPYKKLQCFYRGELEIRALPDEDENYYIVAIMPLLQANMPNLDIGKTSLISV
jgi:hypothetical protein